MTLAKVLHTALVHATGRGKDTDACETRKVRPLREKCNTKRLSLLEWYRMLRVQHEWTIFQAIRFTLWLAR